MLHEAEETITVILPDIRLDDPAIVRRVDRLYWSKWAGFVRSKGVDPEDGLQEVWLVLLRRQHQASRWNPRRGSLATWLCKVMRTACLNLVDRETRRMKRDGVPGEAADVATEATTTWGWAAAR